MEKVILWGTGKTTDILEYYLKKENVCEVCAYTLDKEYLKEKQYNNKPVVPFDEIEKYYSPKEYKLAILIGPVMNNRVREEKYNIARQKGYSFINYISKDSLCDASEIGENVFIFPGVVILPFTKICNNVCIWSDASIGHDCLIMDNCTLADSKLCGYCKIGKNCFLGANCSIADHVSIGEYSIIGIGSVITKDIPENSVVAVKQSKLMPISSFSLCDMVH